MKKIEVKSTNSALRTCVFWLSKLSDSFSQLIGQLESTQAQLNIYNHNFYDDTIASLITQGHSIEQKKALLRHMPPMTDIDAITADFFLFINSNLVFLNSLKINLQLVDLKPHYPQPIAELSKALEKTIKDCTTALSSQLQITLHNPARKAAAGRKHAGLFDNSSDEEMDTDASNTPLQQDTGDSLQKKGRR